MFQCMESLLLSLLPGEELEEPEEQPEQEGLQLRLLRGHRRGEGIERLSRTKQTWSRNSDKQPYFKDTEGEKE